MIKPGDTVYIIANNNYIKEYKVLKVAGGFATLKEINGNGGTKLRTSKIFSSQEEAQRQLLMNTLIICSEYSYLVIFDTIFFILFQLLLFQQKPFLFRLHQNHPIYHCHHQFYLTMHVLYIFQFLVKTNNLALQNIIHNFQNRK